MYNKIWGKLQITFLKFDNIWILDLKILKFEIYSLKFVMFEFYTLIFQNWILPCKI